MKLIIELNSAEMLKAIETGILHKLEAIVSELESDNNSSVDQRNAWADKPGSESNEQEKSKKNTHIMSNSEFKTRLVTLTKSGKKDEVKKALSDRGYKKVSDVKEEDYDEIIKELS